MPALPFRTLRSHLRRGRYRAAKKIEHPVPNHHRLARATYRPPPAKIETLTDAQSVLPSTLWIAVKDIGFSIQARLQAAFNPRSATLAFSASRLSQQTYRRVSLPNLESGSLLAVSCLCVVSEALVTAACGIGGSSFGDPLVILGSPQSLWGGAFPLAKFGTRHNMIARCTRRSSSFSPARLDVPGHYRTRPHGYYYAVKDKTWITRRSRRQSEEDDEREAEEIRQKIRTHLWPKESEAIYWTGEKVYPGLKPISACEVAQDYARETKHHTMTMTDTLKKIGVIIPMKNRHRGTLWKESTKLYSERTSGHVHVLVGRKRSDRSPDRVPVYERDEKPILMKNPRVTRITEEDINTWEITLVKDTTTPGPAGGTAK